MKNPKYMLFMLVVVILAGVAGTGCTAKAKRAYHLSRANKYYEAGQYEKAEIEYLNVLQNDPGNGLAFDRLGLIYYDQGRLQRSMFFLNKGSQLTPDNLDAHLKLGFLYSSVGQFTQALAQANLVLQKNPRDDQAPILLAEGSFAPKDIKTAREQLEALAHNGDSASIEAGLGNLAMHEHDMAAAGAAYKKAQGLDPKSPDVLGGLGLLAWAQDDLKGADADFKAAAEASPVRSPHRMQYVSFKIKTGDAAGAQALLGEIIKEAPDYLPATMRMAEISVAEKNYDEAGKWVDRVLKLDPDNFDGMFFQGELELQMGQTAKAVEDMDRMAHLYPQVPQVNYQLGSAYLAANDLTKAAESLGRALELNPNYVEATLALSEIQIKNKNPEPAIVALERVRQRLPRLLPAQLLLADAYREQNRTDDALSIYQTLETMYPTNMQVVLLHGATLLQMNDQAGARKKFERALELAPDDLTAIGQITDLDIAEKKFDEATKLLDGEEQKSPKQVVFRLLLAKVALAQGKNDQAETMLTQALTVDPGNLSAYLLLAQLYADEGQTEKALAKVDEVMGKDQQNTAALMLSAQIYEKEKQYKGAADAYEKLLKIDPKYSPALNNLAYIYSEYLNNLDRAYDLAQQARELLPYDPSTADTLGWISYKKGIYPTAVSLLKESVTKLPGEAEVQYHYGMACYMMTDEATARTALQQAAQSGKNFPGRDECGTCLSILDINPATADSAARETLEKRVAQKSDDPVALGRLGKIYLREGNNDKAIAAFEGVLQTAPKNLDAMVNLVQLYTAKDPKKAYELAKSANALAPYDYNISRALGRLAFMCGDYEVAASTLQQTVQSHPDDGALQFDYAQAAYSVGKVSDAQTAYQSALGLNLPAAQADQARRELDMMALAAAPAQAAGASARIADVLKSEPDNPAALMAQAAASEYGSDAAAAEKSYEQVLVRYPDLVPAEMKLARLYANEPANLDRALALATRAYNASPQDPETTKMLGIVAVKRGDYTHGANLLKDSSMRMNPDAEVLFYLGSAQYHLKNRVESKANLQQALALKLPSQEADAAKQMLSELK
jgi:tetratricopeptide (TPR) repeat protein